MRAIRSRTFLYDSRTLCRNHCASARMSGSTEKVNNASRQSIQISVIMMPINMNRSPNAATTPDVKRSLMTSTSVVTRVMSRPTGLRS